MNSKANCFVKMGLVASLLVLASVLLSVSLVATNTIESVDVEQFLDERIKTQLEELQVPNATIAVVADGELVFQKGYGYADIEAQIAVNPEQNLFRVGSISKLFTWTAVMQLVEQGKLDLDADVNTYLDFEIPATLLKEPTKNKDSKAEPKPITMAHLLTHTPGFEDFITGLFAISEENFLSLEQYVKKSIPARIFPAGEVIAYSNYGTALAGYIVEQVSGLSYEEYIEQNILVPLEMHNSSFRQPLPEQLAQHMTKAYRFVDGEYLQRGFELMPAPAGGMSTTASDMSRFILAHLEGGSYDGGRILGEETVKQMHSQLFTHHPKVAGMTHGFIENYVNGYRVLSHAGSTMLFDGGLYLLPEKNLGFFMSYSGGNYLIHAEIFQDFMDRYFPNQQVLSQEQEQGAAKRAKQFVGEYHANRKSITTPDRLLVLVTGVITIEVDDNGYLLATAVTGESNCFVETEFGVYVNMREGRSPDPYGQFKTIVFDTDSYGKQMLITDGPMSYTKPAWYSTRMFTVSALVISIILIVGSLIYWMIAFIIRKLTGRIVEQPKLAIIARWLAVAFALVFLVILASFLGSSELDPVYQLPTEAYDPAPESPLMKILPFLLSALALSLIVVTVAIWINKHKSIRARIHYTVYTGAAILLVWILNFWDLL